VADEWLELLPFHQVYTAERVAYKNLVNDIPPPSSARTNNPFREWIGAQIRADAFGYVNAGNPERAAEFAYRDAAVSHVRNGIYGEMWSAATIAAAFVTDDVREALEIGLSEIPRNSRLAEAGRKALQWSREFPTWEACWNRARQDYGGLNWVHTINNALWVMLGLLYGEKDFGRTIAIAVRCGDDTDCNGATAGSILGAMLGADALPERWTAPFHDRVRSYVTGFDGSRVSDLAARTITQHERLRDA
jgi:ADP-ribosylglycohydrolase